MKNKHILPLLFTLMIALAVGCKKSDSTPSGSYLTINGTTKTFDPSNPKVKFVKKLHNGYNPAQWEFTLRDGSFNQTINGMSSDSLEFSITIYDASLSRTQYVLDQYTVNQSSGANKAYLEGAFYLGRNSLPQYGFQSMTGTDLVNLSQENGKINLSFSNLKFYGNYTVSGRISF